MIVLSLDEGGRFEQLNMPQCMLIGGTVLVCKNQQDVDMEEKALRNFFVDICKDQEAVYPADLHFNRVNGTVVNAEKASKVKKALGEALPDFFHRRGRWTRNRSENVAPM